MSMFRLNWLRKWENVYLNGFVPDNDHKFSSLRQFANHSLFHVSKIFNFQNGKHKYWKHKFIYFIHVRTKFFFKSTCKSVTRTELQIVPDWSYHPWKPPRSSLNLAGSALIKAWTLSLSGVQFSVECPWTSPWYSHLALRSYHSGYGGFLGLAGTMGILYFWTNIRSSWA